MPHTRYSLLKKQDPETQEAILRACKAYLPKVVLVEGDTVIKCILKAEVKDVELASALTLEGSPESVILAQTILDHNITEKE